VAQLRLEFHPEAIAEARAAHAWYAERSDTAAAGFLRELDHSVAQVLSAPRRWPKHKLGTRRFVFHRFPFLLVYRVAGNVVEVVAVAHARRRPGYWRSR
jgi:plasmid stabilization system protein ParE